MSKRKVLVRVGEGEERRGGGGKGDPERACRAVSQESELSGEGAAGT